MKRKHTALVILFFLTGCAGTSSRVPVPDPHQEIFLVSNFPQESGLDAQVTLRPASHTVGTLTLSVEGTINPAHVPIPTNTAEQLVFSHCYATLTQIDLSGKVIPGLAQGWESYDKHHRWVLTLNTASHFWDGTPVTAQEVLAAWVAADYRNTTTPSAPTPLRWLQPRSNRIQTPDNRTLVINLPEAVPDLPAQLAHPALAVRGVTRQGSDWPVGTGLCRPTATGHGLALVPAFPQATTWDTLRILENAPSNQHPDLILSTRSGQHGTMIATDLPWSRMYLLVCPPETLGTTDQERRRWTTDLDPQQWELGLSPHLKRELRQGSFLRAQERLCPYLRTNVPAWPWPDFTWAGRTAARDKDLVLYPAGDPIAKDLADILADHAGRPIRPAEELAGRGPLTPPFRPRGGFAPQALGPTTADFEAALQAGRAGAYILPVPRWEGSACRQLADILGRAVWLQEAADNSLIADQPLPQNARALHPLAYADPSQAEQAALRLERSRVLTPLIATRCRLWSRPLLTGIKMDFQGNIDLTGVGWR